MFNVGCVVIHTDQSSLIRIKLALISIDTKSYAKLYDLYFLFDISN